MNRVTEVVSFDAGGTLIEPWPSVGAVYARALEQAGWEGFDPSGLDARFRAAWKARHDFDYTRDAWGRLVGQVFEGLTPRCDDPALFEVLWNAFSRADAWRVFPEVEGVLRELRDAGFRLVVVSNWDERLHGTLEACGLGGYFERVFPSVEWSAPKPDPRFFREVARAVGVKAERIVHVGDGWEEDLLGASGAGWRGVWLSRNHGGAAPGTADSIPDLTGLLARVG